MTPTQRSRFRLALTLALLVAGAVLVHYLILSARPKLPDKLFKLFPKESSIGFILDMQKMIPVLPKEYLEALPPRAKAFVTSSKILVAATEDLGTIYILLEGSRPLEETARLTSDNAEATVIAGYDGYTFENGCVVDLGENRQFFVLGPSPAADLEKRLRNAATELDGLSKNLTTRYEEQSEGVFAMSFGYPGNLTPSLLPGSFFMDLQAAVDFYSLAARRNDDGLIQLKLLLYFPDTSARDLYYLQMPTLLSQFSEDYPDLASVVLDIKMNNVKDTGLQLMVIVPPEVIEPFFGSPEEPAQPDTTPFIPDTPELPF